MIDQKSEVLGGLVDWGIMVGIEVRQSEFWLRSAADKIGYKLDVLRGLVDWGVRVGIKVRKPA